MKQVRIFFLVLVLAIVFGLLSNILFFNVDSEYVFNDEGNQAARSGEELSASLSVSALSPGGSVSVIEDFTSWVIGPTGNIAEATGVDWNVGGYVSPSGSGGGEINPVGALGAGLVGLWHLNELSGDAIDSSLLGNNGIVEAEVLQGVAGIYGNAYEFDGVAGQVDVGEGDGRTEGMNKLTVSVWANKFNTVTSSRTGPIRQKNVFYIRRSHTNYWVFGVNTGAGDIIASSNVKYFDEEWHHLAGVYNGSNVLLYIDGVLQTNQPALTGTTATTANNIEIGREPDYSGVFLGTVDEVAIWNRDLKEAEILLLNASGVSGSFSSNLISSLGEFNKINLSISESGVGMSQVSISTDEGATWCSIADGEELNLLNEGVKCLPVSNFTYNVNFIGDTNLDKLDFVLDYESVVTSCGITNASWRIK